MFYNRPKTAKQGVFEEKNQMSTKELRTLKKHPGQTLTEWGLFLEICDSSSSIDKALAFSSPIFGTHIFSLPIFHLLR